MTRLSIFVPLTALLLVAMSTPAQADWIQTPHCRGSDYSGGFGGQDVSCAFTCESGSAVTLEVTATDPDASVMGDADCGTAVLDCSGQQSCDDAGVTTTAGGGTCSGHSSEFYDSGLKVSCSAEGVEEPTDPSTICVPVVDVCVCVKTGCDGPSPCALGACEPLPPLPVVPNCSEMYENAIAKAGDQVPDFPIKMDVPVEEFCEPKASGVTLWMVQGVAWAVTCVDGECREVEPVCKTSEIVGWRCWVA